jgi:polar amino acid transport system permease protein
MSDLLTSDAGLPGASGRRAVSRPDTAARFSMIAAALAVVGVVVSLLVMRGFHRSLHVTGTQRTVAIVVDWLIALAMCAAVVYPAARAVLTSRQAERAVDRDIYEARSLGDEARTWCWHTVSLFVAVVAVAFLLLVLSATDGQVRRPFLKFSLITSRFGKTLRYFVTKNVKVALITMPLVLMWGLVLAVARLAPGAVGRPVRTMAILYIDLFRGIPGIVNFTLIGFGLPLSGLPWISTWDSERYAILALTITYGAYVAEVYRSGIESIHWGQTAAARSLGLSHGSTMRYVVIPQAVRRIIPPLLNDFIGLQKDTALLTVLGYFEAFAFAKSVNSNNFNLSVTTLVALLFYAITIPQARLVDRLLEREKRRTAGGSSASARKIRRPKAVVA